MRRLLHALPALLLTAALPSSGWADMTAEDREAAAAAGLDLGQVSLQELVAAYGFDAHETSENGPEWPDAYPAHAHSAPSVPNTEETRS